MYVGDYKTKKFKGVQKIDLTELQHLVDHLYEYVTDHRPVLVMQATAPEDHNYLFVVSSKYVMY